MKGHIRTASLFLLLAACDAGGPQAEEPNEPSVMQVDYVSVDHRHAMRFSNKGYQSGDLTSEDISMWPAYPVAIINNDGVECIVVGPAGNTEAFAVKRPMRQGEQYACGDTKFKVIQCFDDCKSAIVERRVLASGPNDLGLTIPSHLIVDTCRGLLTVSQNGNLEGGIPFDAVNLRGKEGVLSSAKPKDCRS